jgi:hypothetical protein
MADTRLLVGLCLSLLISSLAISIVTGTGAATLGDAGGTVNLNINFENNTRGWVNDIETPFSEWKIIDGALTSQGFDRNRFFLDIPSKPDGVYTTTYHIESGGRPYAIIIRDTNWFGDSIQLRVMPTGLYLESGGLFGYQPFQKYFIASIPSKAAITVTYDDEKSLVTVSVDGREIIRDEEVPEDSILSWGTVHYGGIVVDGPGFKVTKIESNAEVYEEQSFSAFDFVSALGSVLVWYTSSGNVLVDAFINLIIKIQQFGIIAVVITMLRGN